MAYNENLPKIFDGSVCAHVASCSARARVFNVITASTCADDVFRLARVSMRFVAHVRATSSYADHCGANDVIVSRCYLLLHETAIAGSVLSACSRIRLPN